MIQLAEALAPCVLWIDEIDKAYLLIMLAVVIYFVVSQASSSNQASKASSQNYTNQVDYSNLEVSLDTSASNSYGCDYRRLRDLLAEGK
jgi:hypothetical protein